MELTLTGLTKTFQNHTAVNNLTLTMDTGVYGLLGVNGAGKTTLMRMLCTLLTPTSGTATWDGQDIFALGPSYRRLLGYLPSLPPRTQLRRLSQESPGPEAVPETMTLEDLFLYYFGERAGETDDTL